MKKLLPLAALALPFPALAQEAAAPVTPSSVVADSAPEEWQRIAPEDLLVMELAPDAAGNPRTVVIQLIPPPFSQPWVENIRTLARAQYWDGSSINRVQDNYVVQWGQPDAGFGGTERAVPEGLNVVPESEYEVSREAITESPIDIVEDAGPISNDSKQAGGRDEDSRVNWNLPDSYADWVQFIDGWSVAAEFEENRFWPTHCYGMVGVGRDVSPDTGDGSQLYTVIGHAPRQLDRNIALVGRVIAGMEHLSSLPRGTGPLGFYETPEELVPILSARIGADMPDPPAFEYLDTGSASFERYVAVRANRQDDFYNIPAGGVDICNIPVPIRRIAE